MKKLVTIAAMETSNGAGERRFVVYRVANSLVPRIGDVLEPSAIQEYVDDDGVADVIITSGETSA